MPIPDRALWTIYADQTAGGFPASNAIDGNNSTFWLSTGSATWSIWANMSAPCTFNRITWLPRQDGFLDVGSEMTVYVSSNGSAWTPVTSRKFDARSMAAQVIRFADQTAQWVKVTVNQAFGGVVSCAEFVVARDANVGVPPRSEWYMVAQNILDNSFAAKYAHDGNASTMWISGGGFPVTLDVDLGLPATFTGIRHLPRQDGYADRPLSVEVYVSDDGLAWGSAIASTTWANNASEKTLDFASQTKRWIRLKIITNQTANASCAELYTSPDPTTPVPFDESAVAVQPQAFVVM